MGTTARLTQFVMETCYEDISPEAVHAAKRVIIDTLGVMLAGSKEPAGKIMSSFVRSLGGNPKATVVGAGFKTSAPNAALANGTMAHALDYDDVSYALGLVMHPDTALLPAALAIGEDVQASGKAVLEALILGFEVWGRLPFSGMDPRAMGIHPTALIGTMGAAITAAKILKLNVSQTRMVLGLAASHAMGMGRNRGTMTKPYHAGKAAQSGVVSALLIKDEFTAAPDLIEGKFGFCDVFSGGNKVDDSKVTENFGKPYLIASPGVGVKKYPTCQLTHRSIDAMLRLVDTYQISPDDVVEIECQTGSMGANVLVFDEPATYLQGKFSMHFCLATALLEGKLGLSEITDEKVNDPKIRQMMKRVRLHFVDEPLPQADVVKIKLKDGREYSLAVDLAKGDCEVPLTDEEIISKYRDCARITLPQDKSKRALEMMLNLEKLPDIGELMDMVS